MEAAFLNYTAIESLEEYVLVAQHRHEVTIFRRTRQWQPEILTEQASILRLGSVEFAIPLTSVYEGVRI